MTVTRIVAALQMYEVAVADIGADNYIVIEPNRTAKGLAHTLASWQLIEQLHMRTDEENGDP